MAFALKSKNRSIQTFHCNESKPSFTFVDEVISLQADGDELEMVRQQFTNIPITKGNICTWAGEVAQFVFRNLVCPVYQPQRVF